MKKIIFILIGASLFIGFVMFALLKQGVSLHEMQMIKWSSLKSPEQAGAVVLRHLYPLIQGQKQFFVVGEGPFSEPFFSSFVNTAAQEKLRTEFFFQNIPRGYMGYTLILKQLPQSIENIDCSNKQSFDCLMAKSYKDFSKKERNSDQTWIQMWRASEKEMVLFYK